MSVCIYCLCKLSIIFFVLYFKRLLKCYSNIKICIQLLVQYYCIQLNDSN